MATVYDANPNRLIQKASEALKALETMKMPEWAKYVKTGASKERPPENPEWWYMRAAAVLRKVYLYEMVGVSKLRTQFGSKKNRGHKPEHFYKGSGKIIRTILQQLEKTELVKFTEKGVHKGRAITPKGKAFLDKLAK